MELEVLVATMGQTDLSLVEKMNLCQNAVIANQCGKWDFTRTQINGKQVQMLSTDTRGVGINRNLALQLAQADILLFADDDVTYYDGALQGVINAFRELPDADVIFFSLDYTKDGEIFEQRRHKTKQLHTWNCLRYGAARMAIRREAVIRHRLTFSTLFGGGCQYSSGEDTLFILDALRAGLKLYASEYVIGKCAKDSSSWFSGYHEKYFYDRGALVACAFPKTKHLMKWYFAWKTGKKARISFRKALRMMNPGIRGFRTLTAWQAKGETEK